MESGFHSVIDENIAYWKAVEEDVVESYTKLAQVIQNESVKKTLGRIIEDSKKHRKMLESVSAVLDSIIKDEGEHARMLMEAKATLEGARSHSG